MEGPHRRQLPPAPGPPTGSSRRRIRRSAWARRCLSANSARERERSEQEHTAAGWRRRCRTSGIRRGLQHGRYPCRDELPKPTHLTDSQRSVGARGFWSTLDGSEDAICHEASVELWLRRKRRSRGSTLPSWHRIRCGDRVGLVARRGSCRTGVDPQLLGRPLGVCPRARELVTVIRRPIGARQSIPRSEAVRDVRPDIAGRPSRCGRTGTVRAPCRGSTK